MTRLQWHSEDIKAELRKKHGSLTALAAEWGITQPAISAVFADPGRSMRVERLISGCLGVPLHELWPDRWHRDGAPNRAGSARALWKLNQLATVVDPYQAIDKPMLIDAVAYEESDRGQITTLNLAGPSAYDRIDEAAKRRQRLGPSGGPLSSTPLPYY